MVDYRWFCLLCMVSGPLSANDKQTQIDSAVKAGRYVEAETLLRKQLDTKSTDWDAHFRLAKVLSWQKKFAEAEREYQVLLAREPANADYLLGLGQVRAWRGDAQSALPLIKKAKSLTPGDSNIWRLHIQALVAVNDDASRRQALIVQQQAAKRFPKLTWAIVIAEQPNQATPPPDRQQVTAEKLDSKNKDFLHTESLIDTALKAGRYAEAETLLHKQIDAESTNWNAHFRLAKVLSWQKKFTEAEREYQMLLAREPGNADYLLGLGQVGVWRGDAQKALPLIEKAKLVMSNDPNVWRLHIQALVAVNDDASRRQALIVQKEAASRFPAQDWAHPPPDQASSEELDHKFDLVHYNQAELGGSYDMLNNGMGYWRSEYLSVEHRFGLQRLVYANFLQTERFRLNDQQFLLGGYYPLSSKLTLNMEGNVSPAPKVLATNSIMGSLQGALGQGWFLTGGYRHSEYGSGPLQQGFATLDSYFADFHAAYTVKVTNSYDKNQFGHRFDFAYFYLDSSFINLTYSMGAETTGFQGTVSETQFLGLHGRHWLNQDWAVTWDLGHTKQGSSYNREDIAIGIRRAF